MCMIDDSDGPVTILGEPGWMKARKEHKCRECFRFIETGERYYREVYVFDGDFTTHRTCEHCKVVREWLVDECGGFLYGGIEEDAREHCWSRQYKMDLYRAVVGMSKYWRRKDGSLLPVPKPIKTTDEILSGIDA